DPVEGGGLRRIRQADGDGDARLRGLGRQRGLRTRRQHLEIDVGDANARSTGCAGLSLYSLDALLPLDTLRSLQPLLPGFAARTRRAFGDALRQDALDDLLQCRCGRNDRA